MAPQILLVEDDPTLAHAIAASLQAHGYRVRSTETVAGALWEVAHEPPHLALIDIELPDGSGWEVVRALAERHQHSVPVIVMSAMPPNVRLVHQWDVLGVLEKPFPMQSLLRLTMDLMVGWGTR